MTDYQRYQHLATLAAAHSTDIEMDIWTWSSLYDYAEGPAPEPTTIEEITNLSASSPEGYSSTDIAFLGRLTNGRWVTCVAWSDTTGFGCQHQVDWRIADTRDEAIAFGLDQESRNKLGLPMPGSAR